MLRSTFSTISRDIVEKAYVPICRRFARFQSRLRRYVGSILFPLANTIPVRWRIKCVQTAADPANIRYVCTFCQRTIKILIRTMIVPQKKYKLRSARRHKNYRPLYKRFWAKEMVSLFQTFMSTRLCRKIEIYYKEEEEMGESCAAYAWRRLT